MADLFPGNSPNPQTDNEFIGDITSSGEQAAKILRSSFGDGYTQRAADGINNIRKTLTLTFAGIDKSHAQQIVDFLNDKEGADAFDFEDPYDGVTSHYVCEKWKRRSKSGDHDTITVKFTQVFDLGI